MVTTRARVKRHAAIPLVRIGIQGRQRAGAAEITPSPSDPFTIRPSSRKICRRPCHSTPPTSTTGFKACSARCRSSAAPSRHISIYPKPLGAPSTGASSSLGAMWRPHSQKCRFTGLPTTLACACTETLTPEQGRSRRRLNRRWATLEVAAGIRTCITIQELCRYLR